MWLRSGKQPTEDVKHQQTRPATLKRDAQNVLQLIHHIEENMTHPFKPGDHLEGQLVNIASGVNASNEIQKSMMSVREQGSKQMEEYIEESVTRHALAVIHRRWINIFR